jgi:Domain of unknown function (DUF4177)
MYQYKILTERDARFSGQFDLETLETTVNSYADEGWRVTDGFTVSSVWKNSKTEIVVILERERTA